MNSGEFSWAKTDFLVTRFLPRKTTTSLDFSGGKLVYLNALFITSGPERITSEGGSPVPVFTQSLYTHASHCIIVSCSRGWIWEAWSSCDFSPWAPCSFGISNSGFQFPNSSSASVKHYPRIYWVLWWVWRICWGFQIQHLVLGVLKQFSKSPEKFLGAVHLEKLKQFNVDTSGLCDICRILKYCL